MQLLLATNNRDKIREIKHLLEDLPITILTADDYLDFPDIEETGATLEENALLKATGIAKWADLPALADDSGLEVDALSGAPGVYSSRYAGPDVTYDDNNRKLLQELKGVPPADRTARFRCVIAIDWADGTHDVVNGAAEGRIAEDIAPGRGFGYDPVFIHTATGIRFSEMSLDEKNRVSHRGLALMRARDAIIARLNRRL